MKSGVVASTILHAAALTWGLWSLAPEPLDMSMSESLPIELVSIEEYSQSVKGAEDPEVAETPAPEATETPQELPMPAENIGDNEVDLDTPPTPEPRPVASEQAAAAAPPPPPAPSEPEPEPAPDPIEAAIAAAQPEPEPVVAEAEPVEPAPAEEQAVAEAEEPAPLKNVPIPQPKPMRPQRQVAEVRPEQPERSEPQPETPVEEAEPEPQETAQQEESEFDADKIAALLNRQKSAGGGARRSEETAALGGRQTTGEKLSQSELDALRGQIQRCWSPPSGVSEAGSLRISIQMRLDPSGQLEAQPQIVDGVGGSMIERVAGEAALRAVQRCAPYSLPAEKYATWSEVVVNFDPSQMF